MKYECFSGTEGKERYNEISWLSRQRVYKHRFKWNLAPGLCNVLCSDLKLFLCSGLEIADGGFLQDWPFEGRNCKRSKICGYLQKDHYDDEWYYPKWPLRGLKLGRSCWNVIVKDESTWIVSHSWRKALKKEWNEKQHWSETGLFNFYV